MSGPKTYGRPEYAQSDEEAIFECIDQHSFASLISTGDNGISVSHLPMLIDRENRKLIGHMARANTHWQRAVDESVLCVFNGPHAYISPRWYEEPNVVPTWNYVAVHVRGTLSVIEDAAATLSVLRRYVERYEGPMPTPWSVDEVDADFVTKLSRQTMAFEIEIESIEGIWKLSQHHPPERTARVVAALEGQSSDNARAIAELMRPAAESPRIE